MALSELEKKRETTLNYLLIRLLFIINASIAVVSVNVLLGETGTLSGVNSVQLFGMTVLAVLVSIAGFVSPFYFDS